MTIKKLILPVCTRVALYSFVFMLLLVSSPILSEDTITEAIYRIAVFTPTTEGNTYWPETHRIMQSAAYSLNVELEIYEFDVSDRFAKVTAGVERLRNEPLPDAAVFSVAFGQAQPLMKAAEESGIPFYLHGPLFPDELEQIGFYPQQEYQNWIGYFNEDEEAKGYILAQYLISAARSTSGIAKDTQEIFVAGINGDRSWYGSILRESGLRRAVDEYQDVELLQMVYTRWLPEEGQAMADRLLRRYPHTTVLWSASDQLAIGAAQAIRRHELFTGNSIHSGGLDLSIAGLDAVLQGELTATVANTRLLWAQVIIDLYDFLRGVDVTSYTGSELSFPPVIATSSNAAEIQDSISRFEELDFHRFSRFHHGAAAPRLSEFEGVQ